MSSDSVNYQTANTHLNCLYCQADKEKVSSLYVTRGSQLIVLLMVEDVSVGTIVQIKSNQIKSNQTKSKII